MVITTLGQCCLNFNVRIHHLETLLGADSDSADLEWAWGSAFLPSSQEAECCWSTDHALGSKDLGNILWSQSAIYEKIFSPNFDAYVDFFTWSFHYIITCTYSKLQRNEQNSSRHPMPFKFAVYTHLHFYASDCLLLQLPPSHLSTPIPWCLLNLI